MVTEAEVTAFEWWHSIDLGGGIVTRGAKTPEIMAAECEAIFKYDVSGKSVLDIGAWDGGFSFEALRRGARIVTATDGYTWAGKDWSSKAPFDLANRALGNRVPSIVVDVRDMTPEAHGIHDIVLFLGVLYHLEDPYSVLKRVAALTGEMLIVETATGLNEIEVPAARFWPSTSLANDPTNFWTPNVACLDGMLRDAGFPHVEIVETAPISRPPADSGIDRHIAFARR